MCSGVVGKMGTVCGLVEVHRREKLSYARKIFLNTRYRNISQQSPFENNIGFILAMITLDCERCM